MRGASSLPLRKVEGHIRTYEQKLRRVGPPVDRRGIDQLGRSGQFLRLVSHDLWWFGP